MCTYTVAARAPGYHEARAEVTVAEGVTVPVTLAMKAQPGAPAPPDGQGHGKDAIAPPQGTSPLVYVGFGVGAAGIVAGTVTGILSLSKTSDLESTCPQKTCAEQAVRDDRASANTLANISNVSFAIGAAGAVAGVIGLLISGGDAPAPASGAVRVSPAVGWARAGVTGSF